MATVDSLFVDPQANKPKAATNKEPVQKTAAPKSNPGKLSVVSGAATPAGTRYEAEAGSLSGGAHPRDASDASGGVLLAGMKGATCSVSVDGGVDGAAELTIRYATAKKAFCTLTLNGVSQDLELPASGGWNTLGSVSITVEIKPGKNPLEFTSQSGMKLDCFDLLIKPLN